MVLVRIVPRLVAMSFAKSCMARPIEKLWSNDESHKTLQNQVASKRKKEASRTNNLFSCVCAVRSVLLIVVTVDRL
jgi:hypothetical protein